MIEVIAGLDGEPWTNCNARHVKCLERVKQLYARIEKLEAENAQLKGSLRWQDWVKEKLYEEV